MKKLFLALLVFCFWANTSFAGLIVIPTVSTDESLTIGFFNNAYNAIKNAINGGIEGGVNVQADSLVEADMADEINPRIRTDEIMGSFTVTGMLPATSANLTSDISAGTSYVDGFRIVTAATSHTYTASRDTYVYINSSGAFVYEEVALGAVQPTDPVNSLLLAKVVTDATAITSVEDLRATAPPGLRTYLDYRAGYVVSWDSATQVKVNAGEIEFGADSTRRRNTTATTLTWADLDVGAEAASTYYYVWAIPSTTNSALSAFKISVSSTDVTGETTERLLGWFYNDAASNISSYEVGCYKGDGSGVPNVVYFWQPSLIGDANDVNTTATGWTTIANGTTRFYSSGRPVNIVYNVWGATTASHAAPRFAVEIDGLVREGSASSGENGQVYGTGILGMATSPGNYSEVLAEGTHTVTLKMAAFAAQTAYALSRDIMIWEE